MAENETTVSQAFASADSDISVATSRDTIKGWNDRRKSNNQIISTMVPFVQLIGIFDDDEYQKIFASNEKRVSITYDDDTPAPWDTKYDIDPSFLNDIKEQLSDRLINLYIMKSVDHGLNVDPTGGIIMAEKVSQVKEVSEGGDASGGIGITDLQVDYGKSNVLGSRKFVLRMTINDPAVLDKKFEYSKLATFGSQFLIIYGWSNPQIIPGYDAAMSPPLLENDPNTRVAGRKRMIVPLRNLGNGGYWSAARVNINNYNFSFNEMGKLEITITLRDEASLGMSSTVVSSIAKKFKAFLQGDLFGQIINDGMGNEFTLREALHSRQQELNKQYQDKEMSQATYEKKWDDLINEFSDQVEIVSNDNTVDDVTSATNYQSFKTDEDAQEANAMKEKPQKGYPHQNALYSFSEFYETVVDDNPEESGGVSNDETDKIADENLQTTAGGVPLKQIVSTQKTPVYYFLGAIMDSIAVSMADVKVGINSAKVPSFYYHPINSESPLSTAFQTKVQSINRQSSFEEKIQEAMIRLKERWLPPAPGRTGLYFPGANILIRLYDRLGGTAPLDLNGRPMAAGLTDGAKAQKLGQYFQQKTTAQSAGTFAVYEGEQTTQKSKVILSLFPAPPQQANMIGAPMRGHVVEINTSDEMYRAQLDAKGLVGVGSLRVFIPDWKEEINFDTEGNVLPSAGSPDGFDPLNPSDYRSAYPQNRGLGGAGRSPFSRDFESRSQDPYGRGGRFIMVVEGKTNVLNNFIRPASGSVSTSKTDHITLLPYDEWRITNLTNWNLLQRKWHNLYREYLAAYFEDLIRKRVNEIEYLGIPIEAIYNEALDLDYLTGKVYDMNRLSYANRNNSWLKPWDDIAGSYGEDFDLDYEETLLNQEIKKYNDIIDLNNKIINGEDTEQRFTFSLGGGLMGNARELVTKINVFKKEIENLTGGKYETINKEGSENQDVMGNNIMIRFKNFLRIEPSEDEFDNDPNKEQIHIYKPVIKYEYQSAGAEITEKWILWNEFNVPTDNYQNIFDAEPREFIDPKNKAERWKQQNQYLYETGVVPSVQRAKGIFDIRVREIAQFQSQLNNIYETFEECQNAIDNAEVKINQATRKFEQYKEFFNEEGKLELSIYDDTSTFDGEGLEIPMGRDKPMHLTTKVAQQWAKRFGRIRKSGTLDVRNYGPPQHGKQYNLPTNVYSFKFDPTKILGNIVGTPKRVIDPAQFIDTSQKLVRVRLTDLSKGLTNNIGASQLLSKDMEPYDTVTDGRKDIITYSSWQAFGLPGVPNENGNNQWGFKVGPPDEEDSYAGGNYVKNYREFLDLFGRGYNPDWEGQLKIVGRWPTVFDTESEMRRSGASARVLDRNTLENTNDNIVVYTMIDDLGQIIIDDNQGWYRPTGWYLEFHGNPIFIYPSRETATKINTSDKYEAGIAPGHVVTTGGFPSSTTNMAYNRQAFGFNGIRDGHTGGFFDNQDRPDGREPKRAQRIADGIADIFKDYWATVTTQWKVLSSGFDKDALKAYKEAHSRLLRRGLSISPTAMAYGQFLSARSNFMKNVGDGVPVNYLGERPSWAYRIGMGEHCPNLTLDMKRSMVIVRFSASQQIYYLGADRAAGPDNGKAAESGPSNTTINWSVIKKEGDYWVFKKDYSGYKAGDYAVYSSYDTIAATEEIVFEGEVVVEANPGTQKPSRGASLIGPTYQKQLAFSNPEYPYGTGTYEKKSELTETYGPHKVPQREDLSGRGNVVEWGALLSGLGEENGFGFFTNVDNRNYSSSMVQPSGEITDGVEINTGFVKFIIENVFAPLPNNRRCAAPHDHNAIDVLDPTNNYHINERIDDVTYGDLFGPLRSDEEKEPSKSALEPASLGNLDNFKIDNVSNIPIRAEVINNLVNRNNTNMSITQFMGEILKPSAMGVNNVPNPQTAMRQRSDGSFEVFSLSNINWDKMSDNYKHLFTNNLTPDETLKRFPPDVIVLDFKAKDSLIENIDMNSTFDPLVARAFRDAAVDFTSTADSLINFLGYEGIAVDLKDYLESNYPELADQNGKKAIEVNENGTVKINKELFLPTSNTPNPEVTSAVTKFLQINSSKLNSMRALLNANKSVKDGGASSYATTLMSNYMRKTTITIHGTTNITPFQKVIIKGIMPDLEGMYIITNTREAITPQGFQTILEGTLLRPPSGDARMAEGKTTVPPEPRQRSTPPESFNDTEELDNLEIG